MKFIQEVVSNLITKHDGQAFHIACFFRFNSGKKNPYEKS